MQGLIFVINGCVIDEIPKLAAYTEANSAPFVVMLHVVNFHCLPETSILWAAKMQEVVHGIIHNVTIQETAIKVI